jgi:hypothetical protein
VALLIEFALYLWPAGLAVSARSFFLQAGLSQVNRAADRHVAVNVPKHESMTPRYLQGFCLPSANISLRTLSNVDGAAATAGPALGGLPPRRVRWLVRNLGPI